MRLQRNILTNQGAGKNLRTKSTGFLFRHWPETFIRHRKTQKCSVVLSSCVINYLFTQNLFPWFSPHFIKFNVESVLEFTHWERCLVYGLRIYQNFAIIFLNCQTKLGLIKFIYSMVKVYQTILIHGLKQFSWKLKHFHKGRVCWKFIYPKEEKKFVLFFHRINILSFISFCLLKTKRLSETVKSKPIKSSPCSVNILMLR